MIKMAFIYRKPSYVFTPTNRFANYVWWYEKALPANPELDVTMIPVQDYFNAEDYPGFDVYFFFGACGGQGPDKMDGVADLHELTICGSQDAHDAQHYYPETGMTRLEACKKHDFDVYVWDDYASYFHKHYPENFEHWWISMGVDPDVYSDVIPWKDRDSSRVLLPGNIKPYFFPIRGRLSGRRDLVTVIPDTDDNYGEGFKRLLEKHSAAITSGYTFHQKFMEIPGAGCLLFCQQRDEPEWEESGFVHGENGLFFSDVGEAESLMAEFLFESDDPKYKRIAEEGRRHIMSNWTHTHTVQKFVDKIKERI